MSKGHVEEYESRDADHAKHKSDVRERALLLPPAVQDILLRQPLNPLRELNFSSMTRYEN